MCLLPNLMPAFANRELCGGNLPVYREGGKGSVATDGFHKPRAL
jgi:hypothetical protein